VYPAIKAKGFVQSGSQAEFLQDIDQFIRFRRTLRLLVDQPGGVAGHARLLKR
jgi:hypothetical protein